MIDGSPHPPGRPLRPSLIPLPCSLSPLFASLEVWNASELLNQDSACCDGRKIQTDDGFGGQIVKHTTVRKTPNMRLQEGNVNRKFSIQVTRVFAPSSLSSSGTTIWGRNLNLRSTYWKRQRMFKTMQSATSPLEAVKWITEYTESLIPVKNNPVKHDLWLIMFLR